MLNFFHVQSCETNIIFQSHSGKFVHSYRSSALLRMKRDPVGFGGLLPTHKAKGSAGAHPWAVLQRVVTSANCGPSHLTVGPAKALNTFHVLSASVETHRPLQQPGGMGSANTGRVSTGDGHHSVVCLISP